MKYIDMHCDTLEKCFLKGHEDFTSLPEFMIDVERLKKAGAAAQFFAMFMLPPYIKEHWGKVIPKDEEYISSLYEIFMNTLSKNPDTIALTRNYAEYKENQEKGIISAFLTFEDGRAVDGKMENLERFYDMGFRLISLTWNGINCFGHPNSADPEAMKLGLTPFGKEAVERMGELGMLVDVSHLSDGGFYDVAEITKVPFVASHSNCRSVSRHQRNMTDDMIRVLANKGGVMGINFEPTFLWYDNEKKISTVENMVRQLKHMLKIGGEDVLAIGTDMDGITGTFEIDSTDKIYMLFDAMDRAGFTSGQIEKFAYLNTERVMKDVLK